MKTRGLADYRPQHDSDCQSLRCIDCGHGPGLHAGMGGCAAFDGVLQDSKRCNCRTFQPKACTCGLDALLRLSETPDIEDEPPPAPPDEAGTSRDPVLAVTHEPIPGLTYITDADTVESATVPFYGSGTDALSEASGPNISPCGHYIRTPLEHLSPDVKAAADAVFQEVPELVERLNRIRHLIAAVVAQQGPRSTAEVMAELFRLTGAECIEIQYGAGKPGYYVTRGQIPWLLEPSPSLPR